MRNELRFRLRLLLLATVLVLPALLTTARPAWALIVHDEKYYSDATYTVLVGECYDNPCSGESWCTGQFTIYEKDRNTSCIPSP
jgi:hypothetical protein